MRGVGNNSTTKTYLGAKHNKIKQQVVGWRILSQDWTASAWETVSLPQKEEKNLQISILNIFTICVHWTPCHIHSLTAIDEEQEYVIQSLVIIINCK